MPRKFDPVAIADLDRRILANMHASIIRAGLDLERGEITQAKHDDRIRWAKEGIEDMSNRPAACGVCESCGVPVRPGDEHVHDTSGEVDFYVCWDCNEFAGDQVHEIIGHLKAV